MKRQDILAEVDLIRPYPNNARTHSAAQIEQIVASIKEFGFTNPILLTEDNLLIAGHGRLEAAKQLGFTHVPAVQLGGLTDNQVKALILADNKLAENAGWDKELLKLELGGLLEADYDMSLTGFDTKEIAALMDPPKLGAMAATWLVPPFSVLNARDGDWLDRKRAWAARIGDEGESRTGTLATEDSIMADIGTVSILDGALAETMCKWFARKGFHAFDPFAGDSVFGYVAASCGLSFQGIEIRPEQAKLNQERVDRDSLPAIYHCDDAANMDSHVKDDSVDFVFSCPPYADLEHYSDDPNDLSNMPHDEFFKAYADILANTYAKLKSDRFAVIVTSEVRAKDGTYINLVGRTIEAMLDAGYSYYNELILVTPCGTLPQRAGKQMKASRKVGRTHQNVLVFYKGDTARIAHALGNDLEVKTDE